MGEGSVGWPGSVGAGVGVGVGAGSLGMIVSPGVTGGLSADAGPVPIALMARTVNVYGTLLVSPVIRQVACAVVQVRAGDPEDDTV